MPNKIDLNILRQEIFDEIYFVPFFEKGTIFQQDFATDIIERFCERFSKILCWSFRDNVLFPEEIQLIADEIKFNIDYKNNASWWCDRKNDSVFSIALKLVDDEVKPLIKKLKKQYDY